MLDIDKLPRGHRHDNIVPEMAENTMFRFLMSLWNGRIADDLIRKYSNDKLKLLSIDTKTNNKMKNQAEMTNRWQGASRRARKLLVNYLIREASKCGKSETIKTQNHNGKIMWITNEYSARSRSEKRRTKNKFIHRFTTCARIVDQKSGACFI